MSKIRKIHSEVPPETSAIRKHKQSQVLFWLIFEDHLIFMTHNPKNTRRRSYTVQTVNLFLKASQFVLFSHILLITMHQSLFHSWIALSVTVKCFWEIFLKGGCMQLFECHCTILVIFGTVLFYSNAICSIFCPISFTGAYKETINGIPITWSTVCL